tara:strand:- start:4 stop:357 length:354 start_codon:yes stop_codon:yes gene_type:complete
MAEICEVCNEEISSENRKVYKVGHGGYDSEEAVIHDYCFNKFLASRKAKLEKIVEQQEKNEAATLQEIKDKSVYVKSFDMPFGNMVGFMIKWALASIPAFIILVMIYGGFWLIIRNL